MRAHILTRVRAHTHHLHAQARAQKTHACVHSHTHTAHNTHCICHSTYSGSYLRANTRVPEPMEAQADKHWCSPHASAFSTIYAPRSTALHSAKRRIGRLLLVCAPHMACSHALRCVRGRVHACPPIISTDPYLVPVRYLPPPYLRPPLVLLDGVGWVLVLFQVFLPEPASSVISGDYIYGLFLHILATQMCLFPILLRYIYEVGLLSVPTHMGVCRVPS